MAKEPKEAAADFASQLESKGFEFEVFDRGYEAYTVDIKGEYRISFVRNL